MDARAWLEPELANGARLVREVMGDGKAAGYAARTLQRAARDLKVARRRDTLTSPWMWSLPTTSDGLVLANLTRSRHARPYTKPWREHGPNRRRRSCPRAIQLNTRHPCTCA